MKVKKIKEIEDKIKEISLSHLSIPSTPCGDQFVFILGKDKVEFKDWKRKEVRESENKKLIIILESPHKDEYKNEAEPEPAKGKTGENIANFLNIVLKTLPSDEYDVILMNAIQYQCSMGVPTNFFRTLSFVALWFDGGKEDFEARLRKLKLTKYDVVINACTVGGGSYTKTLYGSNLNQGFLQEKFSNKKIVFKSATLKELVNEVVKKVRSENKFSYYTTTHPSSWKDETTINLNESV